MSAAMRPGGFGTVPPVKPTGQVKSVGKFDLGSLKGPKDAINPGSSTKIGKGVSAPKAPSPPKAPKPPGMPRFK